MLTSAKGKSWPLESSLYFTEKLFSSVYNGDCVSLITTVGLSLVWFSVPEGKAAADTENDNTRKTEGEWDKKLKVGVEFERKQKKKKVWGNGDGWRRGGE